MRRSFLKSHRNSEAFDFLLAMDFLSRTIRIHAIEAIEALRNLGQKWA